MRRRDLLAGATTWISYTALAQVARGASNSGIKGASSPLVFAYYFLATSTYGYTVANYKKDIREAQSLGIDGFVVAAGAWSSETQYQIWMKNFFKAAQELQTDFKLFISAEVGQSLTAADIHDMVNTYKDHPNYYWFDGKPMLTTSGGERGPRSTDSADGQSFWKTQVFTKGFQAAFYPAFTTMRPAGGQIDTMNPTYGQIMSDYSTWWKGIVDGLSYFTFGGIPETLIDSAEAYARLMREERKEYLAGLSSYYAQTRLDASYLATYEMLGGEGVAQQWLSIINKQMPRWLVLYTWNDVGESYITPASMAEMNSILTDGRIWPPLHPHVGYAELSKYFIEWFKAGTPPAVSKDKLFYFYRTHSESLKPPSSTQTTAFWKLTDNIFITTILTLPAKLRVTSGGSVTDIPLPSGIAHSRVPFRAGSQNIKLLRNEAPILDLNGEEIASSITAYDANPTTGYATYP